MATNSGLVTAQELWDMPDDGYRYELVRGELVKVAHARAEHGDLAAVVLGDLIFHVRAHGFGKVYAAETGFLIGIDPDHVQAPDVAFVRQERVAEAGRVTGYFPGAPDWAIEVISPNDRYTEVEEKVEGWLAAGTAMVVLLNPRNRTAILRLAGQAPEILSAQDILAGGEVVPGWRITAGQIFEA
jgi:Uma2 family endonuclease